MCQLRSFYPPYGALESKIEKFHFSCVYATRKSFFSNNSKSKGPRVLEMCCVSYKWLIAVILHPIWSSSNLQEKFLPPLLGAYRRTILNRVFRHVRCDCEICHRSYLVLHIQIDQKQSSNLLDLEVHIKPLWAPRLLWITQKYNDTKIPFMSY